MFSSRLGRLLYPLLVVASLALPSTAPAATWGGSSLVNPSGVSSTYLQDVSCYYSAEPLFCNAPGGAFFSSLGKWGALAEVGNGSSWTAASGVTANPGEKNGALYGVDCPNYTMCMTVGSYGTSSGVPAPMAQRQVTSAWSLWKIPIPSGASRAELNDVWCVSESNWCMAVGYKMVSGDDKAWAVTFNTAEWPDAKAVEKANATLKSVSCTSASFCIAVGAAGSGGLAEQWNGKTWAETVTQPFAPVTASSTIVNGIKCLSSSKCMASGSFKEASTGRWRAFTNIWDGFQWSAPPTAPLGSGNLEALAYGISCLPTSGEKTWECFTVGEGRNGSTLRPWAAKYTGSWESQTISLVPSAEGAVLRGISCYQTSICKAAGWSLFGGTKEALVENVTP